MNAGHARLTTLIFATASLLLAACGGSQPAATPAEPTAVATTTALPWPVTTLGFAGASVGELRGAFRCFTSGRRSARPLPPA